MAPRFLSDAELEALAGWPSEVARSDLVEHFTLDVGDLRWVRSHRGAATRLGLGLQLCALRFLGFVPAGWPPSPPKWSSAWPSASGLPRPPWPATSPTSTAASAASTSPR